MIQHKLKSTIEFGIGEGVFTGYWGSMNRVVLEHLGPGKYLMADGFPIIELKKDVTDVFIEPEKRDDSRPAVTPLGVALDANWLAVLADESSKDKKNAERYQFLKKFVGRTDMETLGCTEAEAFDEAVDSLMRDFSNRGLLDEPPPGWKWEDEQSTT